MLSSPGNSSQFEFQVREMKTWPFVSCSNTFPALSTVQYYNSHRANVAFQGRTVDRCVSANLIFVMKLLTLQCARSSSDLSSESAVLHDIAKPTGQIFVLDALSNVEGVVRPASDMFTKMWQEYPQSESGPAPHATHSVYQTRSDRSQTDHQAVKVAAVAKFLLDEAEQHTGQLAMWWSPLVATSTTSSSKSKITLIFQNGATPSHNDFQSKMDRQLQHEGLAWAMQISEDLATQTSAGDEHRRPIQQEHVPPKLSNEAVLHALTNSYRGNVEALDDHRDLSSMDKLLRTACEQLASNGVPQPTNVVTEHVRSRLALTAAALSEKYNYASGDTSKIDATKLWELQLQACAEETCGWVPCICEIFMESVMLTCDATLCSGRVAVPTGSISRQSRSDANFNSGADLCLAESSPAFF